MRQRKFPIRRASYMLTSLGQKRLKSKRAQLETKRSRTLEKMEQLGRSQASDPACLSLGMQLLYRIDQELTRIDNTLKYAVIVSDASGAITVPPKFMGRQRNKKAL